MRIIKALVYILLIFLIPTSVYLYASTIYEGETIVAIDLEGLIQSDELSVRSVISSRVRSQFSQKVIDEDIRALYNLDLFVDIKVDVIEKDEGVLVTFIFSELPTIREVIIKGNKRISRWAIKDEIILKKGSVYREGEVYDDVIRIVELYREKGFPRTDVEYKVIKTKEKDIKTGKEKNTVDVVFTIKEGKRLIIKPKGIHFSGNKAVRKDKLLSIMKTRYRGYLLFSDGFFREDDFELDKIEILRHYNSLGYIDAEIIKVDKKVELNEKAQREEMEITIYIKEGGQYKFGGVVIEGNEIFTDNELYSLITMEKGLVFNKTQWDSDVQAIRNLLAENGYIYFSMDIKEQKDNEKLAVSYNINITENNKAHVEHIFITGNDKTKKFVIEREIEVLEGEIFNSYKIQRSREKLYNLQYFSAVHIDVKPGSEFGLVDLIFDVEEQRTGLFTFGVSYSTAGYGFSLFEEVAAINFLGRGIRLHEKVELGITRQAVEVGIDEPWLFNTPTSAGLTLSWARTEYGTISGDYVYTYNDGQIIPGTDIEVPDKVTWEDVDGTYVYDYSDANTMTYVNTAYMAALRFGRRLGKYYGIESEIAFSVFQNTPTSDNIPFDPGLREQYYNGWPWNWKNHLSLTGYRDTRDYVYFATKGSLISQSITLYGGLLGGYSHFIRLNTDLNFNTKTFWVFVLSARLNFGFIFPYPGMPLTIDDSDYIRVDCMNEGRGWQNPSQWGSLYSIRGRSELNFSLEHRFPIEERVIWGLTFFDISGIYDDPADFTIDFREFYYSFGIGISFVIPNFPIRLYLARRFKYDETLGMFQLANSQYLFRNWDFVFAIAGFF